MKAFASHIGQVKIYEKRTGQKQTKTEDTDHGSAPIGSGHRMAAVAVEEALLRLENVEVVQGNVFDFFPSVIGKAFLKFYGTVLRFCSFLYELSYRWSNQGGGSLWMRNLLNGILLRLGKAFIEEVKPDVVFSTHATPTGILSLYKQKYDPVVAGRRDNRFYGGIAEACKWAQRTLIL